MRNLKLKQNFFNTNRLEKYGLGLLILFFGFLYLTTLPRLPVSYNQSDVFLSIANNGGIALPPGYPLYLMLLGLVLAIPIGLSAAVKGSLLSLGLSLLTLSLVYKGSLLIYILAFKKYESGHLKKPPSYEGVFVAFLTAMTLGVNYLFWTYSLIPETAIFSALLVALLVFLILKMETAAKLKLPRYLVLIGLVLGLLVSHQPILIILLPVLFFQWYRFYRKIPLTKGLLALPVFLGTWFLPYLLLLFGRAYPGEPGYPFDPSLLGIIDLMLGRGAHGYYSAPNPFLADLYLNLDINRLLSIFYEYIKLVVIYFGPAVLAVGVIAFKAGYDRLPKASLSLFLPYGLLSIGLVGLIGWGAEWDQQANTLNYYLPGFVAASFLLPFGFLWLWRRLGRVAGVLTKNDRAIGLGLAGLLILPLIIQGFMMYKPADLSGYDLIYRKYSSILEAAEPEALVACFSEVACGSLLYQHYVENKRVDIDILPFFTSLTPQTLRKPGFLGFEYDNDQYILFDGVTWNLEKRPVYAVEINNSFYEVLGLDYPFMYYLPHGGYGKLVKNLPDEITPIEMTDSNEWLKRRTVIFDPMKNLHKSAPARDHILNGSIYLKMDRRDLAKMELTQAASIFYQFSEEEQKRITGLLSDIEQQQPQVAFAPGHKIASAAAILELVPSLMERKQYRAVYMNAMAAIASEPKNPQAHLALAKMYEATDNPLFAARVYLNILRLEPDNTEATGALNRLEAN